MDAAKNFSKNLLCKVNFKLGNKFTHPEVCVITPNNSTAFRLTYIFTLNTSDDDYGKRQNFSLNAIIICYDYPKIKFALAFSASICSV